MKSVLTLLFTCVCLFSFSQSVQVEGYIYETGNRGYIGGVNISAENIKTEKLIGKTITNEEGFFSVEVPANTEVRIYATKEMFDVKKMDISVGTGKAFVKLEMGRKPGYKFEVTLAEKRDNENIIADAIEGARIEVYNNTKRESVMDLKEHMSPEFQLNLEKGNHYTILIRKEGFLSKRMEAKVNVEGCILCFEGVGSVNPGVADNLTEGNAFGVLLANVELERIFNGKKMEVQNLYYDTNKWRLRADAKQELGKVITLMRDNPNLTLELGSHTDSRGEDSSNQLLSERRAKSAVDYLIMKGDIAKARIVSKGYGENILINNCGDGSRCSDAEHAKNRRTELKIVGITNVAEVKSLKKMKEEVHMEEELLKLMDQEEVRADSAEDLEKILKKEESSIEGLEEIEEENQKTKESKIEEEVEQDIEEELEVIEEVKEVESNVEKIIAEEIQEKIETQEITEEIEEEISTPAKNKKHTKDFDDMPGLEVIEPVSKTSGEFKVVLLRTTEPLGVSDPMFKRNNNIEIFRDTDRTFNYMIGGFKTEDDAQSFYNTYIKSLYKDSFLAIIKDGKMIKK
jgi:outer membrane protein OmpA-like peptidoglycan-associated protein